MSKFIKPQTILRIALKIKLYLILVFSFFQGYGQNTSKHNILFIAIDDLRADLGCYGVEPEPVVEVPVSDGSDDSASTADDASRSRPKPR